MMWECSCIRPVSKALVYRGSEQLDVELGSHHGSQLGSAAASSFEGKELDEDEAAAAADFTPMTDEKRILVNEWIAKLGEDVPDEQAPIEVSFYCHQRAHARAVCERLPFSMSPVDLLLPSTSSRKQRCYCLTDT